jgi:hypothetical protein
MLPQQWKLNKRRKCVRYSSSICEWIRTERRSECKERFYYNFSHFSHFRDGFSSFSLSLTPRPAFASSPVGLKGILSASRHHFHEDVQRVREKKLSIAHYHTCRGLSCRSARKCCRALLSFFRRPSQDGEEEEGSKREQKGKKGDSLDVYIVMMPF